MDILFSVLFGLSAGYIINYLSDILPTNRKISVPFCVYCLKPFTLVDYLKLTTCRHCNSARSWRTYIVFLFEMSCSILLWLLPPARMGYFLSLLIISYFLLVVVIDFEHRLILHMVSLPGIIFGIVVGTIRLNLPTSLVGGLTGFCIMLSFYGFGILFARYRAKKGFSDGEEALGFGDVTISTVLGFMLGWPFILYGLMIGILFGGIISFILLVYLVGIKKYEPMTIFTAYGPYLVFGAAMLIFFPNFLTILSGK